MSSSDTVIRSERFHTKRDAMHAFVAEVEATLDGDGVELPSPPAAALKIRQALTDENAGIASITESIGAAPAIAARILNVANCTLFHSSPKPVRDLRSAVVRLGLRMVNNLTLSIAAQQVFIGDAAEPAMPHVNEVWRHSVHVATLSHLLTTHAPEVSEDEAFLAGLLHEIGKLYILLRAKDHPELLGSADVFRAVVDEWQTRIGAAIMRAWDFPAELTDAVAGHAYCELSCSSPVTLMEIVAVANYLAESFDSPQFESLLGKGADFGALSIDRETLDWMLAVSATDSRQLIAALAS